MIIGLTGDNHYLLKQRMDKLINDYLAEHGELAVEQIDAETAEAEAVLAAVQSLPFLASRKLVVVRSLSDNKVASRQINQIIDTAGNTTDLIFYEPQSDKRTSYFKQLKSLTQLEEYNQIDNRALAVWLSQEAKQIGGKLSLSDANYLIERAGPNQELLANELQKLLTYEMNVSRQNIDLLSVKTPQSKVFDLLEAAFGGNKKRALELYTEQRAQKVEPQTIMALIAWQLELVALAYYGKGKDAAEIARDAHIATYPVQKAQRLAARLDLDNLRQLIRSALEIDYKSRTSALDLDEAIKTYLITI